MHEAEAARSRIVALAGGKGGVGRSLLATNIGVYLAQIGKRVLLCDGDPFAFSLGHLLGLERAAKTAGQTDVSGLSLLMTAGIENPAEVRDLIASFEGDIVLVDLPAYPTARTRELWAGADVCVLVVTPEPGAVEGAVRLLRQVKENSPESALRPLLIVNQTRSKADLELGANVRTTVLRVLGVRIELLGTVESDEAVWLAVRKRRPLLADYPDARASRDIERVARRLLTLEAEPIRRMPVVRKLEDAGYYELLEVERGSMDEEIRRAHRRMRDVYSPGSLALSGLLGRLEALSVQKRIEEAYETLIDPERRRQYDLDAFVDDHHKPAVLDARTPPPPGPAPNEPAVDVATLFTGDLLRRIRTARGIDLQEIARRTKVGARYLRAIEDERYKELPPRVFVRGFLVDYARCLRLDPTHVTRTYLARMEDVTGGHE